MNGQRRLWHLLYCRSNIHSFKDEGGRASIVSACQSNSNASRSALIRSSCDHIFYFPTLDHELSIVADVFDAGSKDTAAGFLLPVNQGALRSHGAPATLVKSDVYKWEMKFRMQALQRARIAAIMRWQFRMCGVCGFLLLCGLPPWLHASSTAIQADDKALESKIIFLILWPWKTWYY